LQAVVTLTSHITKRTIGNHNQQRDKNHTVHK
jgi:hypothetical protein